MIDGTPPPDPPVDRDRRLIRVARRRAHDRVREITEARHRAFRAAFDDELASTVRSASPFLVALLEGEGLTLDDAVRLIQPAPGWPNRPRLSGDALGSHWGHRHIFRHYVARIATAGGIARPVRDGFHGHSFVLASGGFARITVVGHSLEVEARVGPVRFETRFGILRVEFDFAIPETLAIACVGCLIDEVVDHAILLGRGWRVVGMEDAISPFVGPVLVAVTGAVPYRPPGQGVGPVRSWPLR